MRERKESRTGQLQRRGLNDSAAVPLRSVSECQHNVKQLYGIMQTVLGQPQVLPAVLLPEVHPIPLQSHSAYTARSMCFLQQVLLEDHPGLWRRRPSVLLPVAARLRLHRPRPARTAPVRRLLRNLCERGGQVGVARPRRPAAARAVRWALQVAAAQRGIAPQQGQAVRHLPTGSCVHVRRDRFVSCYSWGALLLR